MSLKQKMWLVPVLFSIHNTEEAILMVSAFNSIKENVPSLLKEYVSVLTYEQFLVALVIVTVLPYLICIFGKIDQSGSIAQYLLLLLQTTIFLNIFSHIIMTIAFHTYSPGLGTALAINLPFSLFLLNEVKTKKWFTKRSLIMMVPLAILIHGPILWGLFYISGLITN